MWRRIGGGVISLVVVLWALVGMLGNIDFVVEKIGDPGWIGDVIAYVVSIPNWLVLFIGVTGLSLAIRPGLWRDIRSLWASSTDSTVAPKMEFIFGEGRPFHRMEGNTRFYRVGVKNNQAEKTIHNVEVKLLSVTPYDHEYVGSTLTAMFQTPIFDLRPKQTVHIDVVRLEELRGTNGPPAELDKSRPFGELRGEAGHLGFEQDGRRFDKAGKEVLEEIRFHYGDHTRPNGIPQGQYIIELAAYGDDTSTTAKFSIDIDAQGRLQFVRV